MVKIEKLKTEICKKFRKKFLNFSWSKPPWSVWLTFILGITITGAVSVYFELYKKTIQQQTFDQKVLKFKMNLAQCHLHHQSLLKSLSALLNTCPNLSYNEWQVFIHRIITPELFSAVLGIGYIELVNQKALPSFLKDLENQFNCPVNVQGDQESSPLCLLKYPTKMNLLKRDIHTYLGFNVCSRETSRVAMMQARDEARGILTPLLYIEDCDIQKPALIAYFPVYEHTRFFDKKVSIFLRQKNIKGWVSLSLDVQEFLKSFIPEHTYITIYDNGRKIFSMTPPPNLTEKYHFTAHVGGRSWDIHMGSKPIHTLHTLIRLFIPLMGFVFSIILSFFLWSLLTTRQRALKMAHDISKDLQDKEFKNRTMVNNIPGAIFRCTPCINWKIEFISDGIKNLTGYTAHEFMSQSITLSCLLHPSDIELVETTIGLNPHHAYSYFVEYRIIHKNGTLRWIYERGQVIRDRDTKKLFLTGALFDITDKKENEKDLRKLTLAMQNMTEGMIYLNKKGCFITVNQAFLSLFNETTNIFIGQSIFLFIHKDFQQNFMNLMTENEKTITVKFIRSDQTEFYALVSCLHSFNDDNVNEGYFCFIRDITDKILEEKKLAQALEEANEANQAKSDFLATMSHELRTPLNAIIGYSEMLMEEYDENQNILKDLKKINFSGRHLLDLINDILDVSKLEAGKVTLFLETFSILDLMDNLKIIIIPYVEKNHNTFVIHCPQTMGDMYCDFMKLKQSLLNLLSNAAKFTSHGTITLTVEDVIIDNKDYVHFSVKDTGCGMTPEQIKKLFQPFSQADSSTTRKYGGTGLGLTITKQFVELLNGTTTVQSEPEKGSNFSLYLPRIYKDNKN